MHYMPAIETVGRDTLLFKDGKLLATMYVGSKCDNQCVVYIRRNDEAAFAVLAEDSAVKLLGRHAGWRFCTWDGSPLTMYEDEEPGRQAGMRIVDKCNFEYGLVNAAIFGHLPGYRSALTREA